MSSKAKIYPIYASSTPTPLLMVGTAMLFSCCKKFSHNWRWFRCQDVNTLSSRKKNLLLVYPLELSSLGMISLKLRAADTWIVFTALWYNQELTVYKLISKNYHLISKLNTARQEHEWLTFIFFTNTGILKRWAISQQM